MGVESVLTASTLFGFFLTLTRIGSVFVFVPIPGASSGVPAAKVVLILAVTIALFPLWPHPAATFSAGLFTLWVFSEAAFGAGIGLLVAFITESFLVGAQMIGLPAGFSYASTIDPSTQADSTVLAVMAQTISSLLFFTMGLDREVIRIFAGSLSAFPPGTYQLSRSTAETVLRAGGTMFSSGLRLALPVIAVLIMVDISLALLGRINSQLQLHSIAFPAKLLLSMGMLIWVVILIPALFRGTADAVFGAVRALAVR